MTLKLFNYTTAAESPQSIGVERTNANAAQAITDSIGAPMETNRPEVTLTTPRDVYHTLNNHSKEYSRQDTYDNLSGTDDTARVNNAYHAIANYIPQANQTENTLRSNAQEAIASIILHAHKHWNNRTEKVIRSDLTTPEHQIHQMERSDMKAELHYLTSSFQNLGFTPDTASLIAKGLMREGWCGRGHNKNPDDLKRNPDRLHTNMTNLYPEIKPFKEHLGIRRFNYENIIGSGSNATILLHNNQVYKVQKKGGDNLEQEYTNHIKVQNLFEKGREESFKIDLSESKADIYYHNQLIASYNRFSNMYSALKQGEMKNGVHNINAIADYIKIPKTQMYKSNGITYIVMDRIPGNTIYNLFSRQEMNYIDQISLPEDIGNLSDLYLEDKMNYELKRNYERRKKETFDFLNQTNIKATLKRIQSITKEEFELIKAKFDISYNYESFLGMEIEEFEDLPVLLKKELGFITINYENAAGTGLATLFPLLSESTYKYAGFELFLLYLQTQGVSHDDLHAENIMIDGDIQLRCLDFGRTIFSNSDI